MNFWNKFFRHVAVVVFLMVLATIIALGAGFGWGTRNMGWCLAIAWAAWLICIINEWAGY